MFLDKRQAFENTSGTENEYRIMRATTRKLRNGEHNSILNWGMESITVSYSDFLDQKQSSSDVL